MFIYILVDMTASIKRCVKLNAFSKKLKISIDSKCTRQTFLLNERKWSFVMHDIFNVLLC